MFRQVSFWLVFLSASALTAQNFRLGVDYSQQIGNGSHLVTNLAVGTDAQGVVYALGGSYIGAPQGVLTKLDPAGHVLSQTALTVFAQAMAVDSFGNVYLTETPDSTNFFVEKLAPGGGPPVYQTSLGSVQPTAIAVDSLGRVYVTGNSVQGMQTTTGAFQPAASDNSGRNGFVMRLKADGSVDYATYLGITIPAGIAVDWAGDAFIAGSYQGGSYPITPGAYFTSGNGLLTELNANGGGLVYSTFLPGNAACCVAVDSAGNATVALAGQSWQSFLVLRFNPQGSQLLFSRELPGSSLPSALAIDAAGNSYVVLAAGTSNGLVAGPLAANYPVKASVTTCSAGLNSGLAVLDPSGTVLQSTYIPSPAAGFAPYQPAIAAGANGAVEVLEATQTQGLQMALAQFSPNSETPPVQLACMGNAANYDSTAISGGELVSLFGEGLGPAAGAQPAVTVQTGFQTQLAGVQVTFNGTPAPLLYAQDGQINAIAPWSIQSGQTVEVCVNYQGAATNCITRTAVNAHPGVFMYNGSTLVVNQDGTINSTDHPAPVGSYVTVYATGLGPIAPAQPDGSIAGFPLPQNVLPVTLTSVMQGVPIFSPPGAPTSWPVPVEYAGPAPFEVAGVSQINFQVIAEGWPISLTVGAGQCWISLAIAFD